MCSMSILQATSLIAKASSFYLTRAANTDDPVERMKLVITSTIAFLYPSHQFEKPLNPILGETLEEFLDDGTTIFLE